MTPPRTWLAIPPTGLACVALAIAAGLPPVAVLACGALGAALAAAVRACDGPSLATAIVAAAAGLLGVLGVVQLDDASAARAAFAGAAALFAIAEVARVESASPLPALGAAVVAAVLDPAYLVLVPVAGLRFAFGPWPRARWAIAVPLAGLLACALAALAALAHAGTFALLWVAWSGHPGPAVPGARVLWLAGDALGPLVAVAAVVGLAGGALRGRYAAAALLGITAGAFALAVRAGTITPATPIAAALAAGLGISRLAALVRHPVGQACIGATAAFVLLVVPVWTLAAR